MFNYKYINILLETSLFKELFKEFFNFLIKNQNQNHLKKIDKLIYINGKGSQRT